MWCIELGEFLTDANFLSLHALLLFFISKSFKKLQTRSFIFLKYSFPTYLIKTMYTENCSCS